MNVTFLFLFFGLATVRPKNKTVVLFCLNNFLEKLKASCSHYNNPPQTHTAYIIGRILHIRSDQKFHR